MDRPLSGREVNLNIYQHIQRDTFVEGSIHISRTLRSVHICPHETVKTLNDQLRPRALITHWNSYE